MDNSNHRAQELREAEIELKLASQMLSRRRLATLSGILILLEDAATKCSAAGADPQSPLATAIRDLRAKTKRQYRNLLLTYGMIAAAVLVVGAIAGWKLWTMPYGDSPRITDPKAGDTVDMTISVKGSAPRDSLLPGTQFYVLVKPEGLDYWAQLNPNVITTMSSSGWQMDNVGIGQDPDQGKIFSICAILTGQTLRKDWHEREMPPGDAHCIGVTRK